MTLNLCWLAISFSLPIVFPVPVSLLCQVGEDKVHTALSLVGYESDLRKAMEYVFGSTLVCDTLDNAKRVAFDKQVMTKTVTLGGDIFDPQGTLSGGENEEESCTWVCVIELLVCKDEQTKTLELCFRVTKKMAQLDVLCTQMMLKTVRLLSIFSISFEP